MEKPLSSQPTKTKEKEQEGERNFFAERSLGKKIN
jgi:hypothetical protein